QTPGEDFFLQRFGLLVRTVDHLFTYSSDQATVGCVKLLSQQPDICIYFNKSAAALGIYLQICSFPCCPDHLGG
ncbi:hypothetical protein, partial [Cohnella sp. GCM10012308]|uniref:hypothetical protein n=1 Tax=Cohnella sp. GCM10012308 TaxID=3317329 RepID=UPI00360828E2